MITRDFYFVAFGKHVAHFRRECASFRRSMNWGSNGKTLFTQPKGKTLCDHCQAIEKRVKRAAKAKARRAKNIKTTASTLMAIIPKLVAKPKGLK